jgi:hypothetical protein
MISMRKHLLMGVYHTGTVFTNKKINDLCLDMIAVVITIK